MSDKKNEWEFTAEYLLRKFIKDKAVKPHEHTLKKITGFYSEKQFTCLYVDSVLKPTALNGYYRIREKYVDGCFMPYVQFKINEDESN